MGGGFLWVEDSGDGEGEVQVVRGGWELGFGVFCCAGDGVFVWLVLESCFVVDFRREFWSTCNVYFENSETVRINVQVLENALLYSRDICPGSCYDGDFGCLEKVAGEVEADSSACGTD